MGAGGLRIKAFQRLHHMVETDVDCWRCECDHDVRILCVRFKNGALEVNWEDKPEKVFRAHYLVPESVCHAVQDLQRGLRRRSVARTAAAQGPRLRRRSVQGTERDSQQPLPSPQEHYDEASEEGEILDPSEEGTADHLVTPAVMRRKAPGTGRKPLRAVKKSCKR